MPPLVRPREVQELFSDLWQVPRFSGLRSGFRPHVDCFRTEDSLTILVELPGIDPEAVDVVVAEGNLYLVGKRDLIPAPGDYDRSMPDAVVIPRIPAEGRELFAKIGYSY